MRSSQTQLPRWLRVGSCNREIRRLGRSTIAASFSAIQFCRRKIPDVTSWFDRRSFTFLSKAQPVSKSTPRHVSFASAIRFLRRVLGAGGGYASAHGGRLSILNNRVRLDFNQPIWINEAHDVHDCVRRADTAKKLAIDQGSLFPIFDAS
jgi:hypothetical protein